MFPRVLRLPREEFEKFGGRAAEKSASSYFLVKTKRNNVTGNRFGVVVGARVDKRATVRNALKRLVSRVVKEWPANGRDFLVIVLPSAATLHKKELAQDLGRVGEKFLQAP